jgi:hypothetical protein
MATINSIWLKNLSGHIGRELVFKQYENKTVVSKYPNMSKRKLSKKQLHNHDVMAEANYEAQRIMASEKLRKEAQVRLNVTRNKLYHALIREYFATAKQS